MTTQLRGLLLGLLCAVTFSCQSGPSAADTAADRAVWKAVSSATADGVIDEQEAPLFAQLLLDWDTRIAADEKAAGQATDPQRYLKEMLRVYGVAAIQVVLGPELQKRAPTVFKLIDKNADGVLEEDEILSLDPADPVVAAVIVQTVYSMIRQKHQ